MQATVCKWKPNRLPLPIMKCEVGVVSVSQISAWFIFIEAASSCKVLANTLLAGRRRGEQGGWGCSGRVQEPSPPAGMQQRAVEMELQERKGKLHGDKWPSYQFC